MITPATLNLTVYRGTDFELVVRRLVEVDGDAYDLTDWTPIAQVRATASNGTLITTLNATLGTPTNGEVEMSLTPTATLALAAGEYVWDLLFEDPDGVRSGPYLAGRFVVAEPVTKFP